MDHKNLLGREEIAGVQTRVINGIHVVVVPENTTSVNSARVKDIIEDDLPIATEDDKA